MEVVFKRTGARRYAVNVAVPGRGVQRIHPAPGYDDDIPHDLVHYVVEAKLRLTNGVFGRAAQGGGSFIAATDHDATPRARARVLWRALPIEGELAFVWPSIEPVLRGPRDEPGAVPSGRM